MIQVTLDELVKKARQAGRLTHESPQLSVIIPVFNHAEYLPACLLSVFEQQAEPFELVCIDDASSDERVGQILRVLEGIPGITVRFNSANLGISESQNRAVETAKGEYLAFLDCDDLLLPGALSRMQATIQEQQHLDYVFSDRRVIDSEGKKTFDAVYDLVKSERGIIADLSDRMIASHLKVIRRESYRRVGGCSNRYSGIQDWELALKIARFGRFHYLPEVLYAHRTHAVSITTSDSRGQAKKSNVLRREYLESARQAVLTDDQPNTVFAIKTLLGQGWYCPDEVKQAWQRGRRCVLDARGAQSAEAIEFIVDFNSYFDRILIDRADVGAKIVGSLWLPGILRSPLHFDVPNAGSVCLP